jgi:poly(A) polymerase
MDAEEIFSDDPLRILRAVRFRSRFGFKYSDRVKKALASQAHKLLWLPKERVLDEFNKILLGEYAGKALQDMLDYKLLNYIVPELTVLAATSQESPYHSKDVWLHTVGVVENAPADLALKYAALFHDIGKPYTKTSDGKSVHFYNHEDVSALMTEAILGRMGLPRRLTEEVVYLVTNHMRANMYEPKWSDSAVKRFIVDTGENLDKLMVLSRADITSHNPVKVSLHLGDLEDFTRRIEELKNYKELKCPLDGKTIMEYFSLAPGPKVGEYKDAIMEALASGELLLGVDKKVMLHFLEGKFNRV